MVSSVFLVRMMFNGVCQPVSLSHVFIITACLLPAASRQKRCGLLVSSLPLSGTARTSRDRRELCRSSVCAPMKTLRSRSRRRARRKWRRNEWNLGMLLSDFYSTLKIVEEIRCSSLALPPSGRLVLVFVWLFFFHLFKHENKNAAKYLWFVI